MSADVPQNKVQAIEALAAQAVICGKSQEDAFIQARELRGKQDTVMIPPFDDLHIGNITAQ